MRREASWLVVLLFVGGASVGACGSGGSGNNKGGGAGGGAGADAGAGGGGGSDAGRGGGSGGIDAGGGTDAGTDAAATCSPSMQYGGGEMTQTGGFTVTAKIADETGAAVPGLPVLLCGLNICDAPSTTQADGTITISTTLAMMKPAFRFGDAVAYAELAIPLTMATTDFTAGGTKVLNTAKLADAPGAALTPGTSATSGDVTIAVPAGASVGIDELIYSTPSAQLLHTVSIPLANEGPVLASSGKTDFALLYGLSPSETPVCPAATVTVALPHTTQQPNDFGWAAGAAVEFSIMTIDTGQTYAPFAGWAKMSDGTVSADGKSVSTQGAQGFIFLEAFAVRLHQ